MTTSGRERDTVAAVDPDGSEALRVRLAEAVYRHLHDKQLPREGSQMRAYWLDVMGAALPDVLAHGREQATRAAEQAPRDAAESAFIERLAREEVRLGMSSGAMVWDALGWGPYHGHQALVTAQPYDMGDWTLCLHAYSAAPAHLQLVMRPAMDRFARELRRLGEAECSEWRINSDRFGALTWPVDELGGHA